MHAREGVFLLNILKKVIGIDKRTKKVLAEEVQTSNFNFPVGGG